MRKASGLVIARPRRGRGALSAKREEVPLGCNLGKAAAFSPMAFPQFGRVLRDCHVGLRPPRNDKLDGIAPMNLCRKYCHPAGRSLSAIGSCRYCSSDSVAQGSRICHCEAPKGPWQSREGTADIHRVPPNAIAIKFDCSGAHCAAVGGFAALRMRRAPCG